MVDKADVRLFVTGGKCPYYPSGIENLRNRDPLPDLRNLSDESMYAVVSLRFNGTHDRADIIEAVRSDYGYSIREYVGEWRFPYGTFPEHSLFFFNTKNDELVDANSFVKDVETIRNDIVKDNVFIARKSDNSIGLLSESGKSCYQVRDITRKNTMEDALTKTRYGADALAEDRFRLTDRYRWGPFSPYFANIPISRGYIYLGIVK